MVFITFVSFQHWLDVTKSIKKQVKSEFTEVRPYSIWLIYLVWKLFLPAFWILAVLYWVTHSNMFWAFVSLSLSVGPPYCLHMRVKFYSSEPNNLHEELTRWIKQHTLGFFFSGSVFTDRCDILSLVVSWFFTFNFHTLLFRLFCQIPICATAEARRPQWEVGIFCFVIAVCLIHRTFLIKCYAQKYCLHWEKKTDFQGPN